MLSFLLVILYSLFIYRTILAFYYDSKLGIKTRGYRKAEKSSFSRTESTPYSAIKIISKKMKFKDSDCLVDFGSGKGRVTIAFNYFSNIQTIGIEAGKDAIEDFDSNLELYMSKHGYKDVSSELNMAQDYKIRKNDNIFFFFNPFDLETFKQVMDNIEENLENKKESLVILYAPLPSFKHHMKERGIPVEKKITHWGKIFPSESIFIYKLTL